LPIEYSITGFLKAAAVSLNISMDSLSKLWRRALVLDINAVYREGDIDTCALLFAGLTGEVAPGHEKLQRMKCKIRIWARILLFISDRATKVKNYNESVWWFSRNFWRTLRQVLGQVGVIF
jgi:hypothetical protein